MQYYFMKALSWSMCRTPATMRRTVGTLLGKASWLAVPAKRKTMAIDNIMQGMQLDLQQAEHIAKQSVTRFGPMFVEVLTMSNLTVDNIDQLVTIEGQENLAQALSHGRGAILATAHCGNWELLGAALALKGFPLIGVAQKQANLAMDRFINEQRVLSGMQVTYKSDVLEMVRLLSKGKVIGLLMDQDAHENGIFVDFFGRPASTPQGAAALARLKDSPIVPALISRQGQKHTITIMPMQWIAKSKNKQQDITEMTQQLTAIIERHIRKYPHEWFWLHNRWKTNQNKVKNL